MPPRKTEAPGVGLRLNMPGAPATWHHLPDHGVWVHPIHPTPCGGPGEPSLDLVDRLHRDPGCGVERVEIPDMQTARDHLDDHLRQLRGLAPRIRDAAVGDEHLVAAAQTTDDVKGA